LLCNFINLLRRVSGHDLVWSLTLVSPVMPESRADIQEST
jgi:hypothetical protein